MSEQAQEAMALTFKTVASLRKALIEAQKQAILAVDELENMTYAAQPAVNAFGSPDAMDGIHAACESIENIVKCLGDAIEHSDVTKTSLRSINVPVTPGVAPVVQETLPEEIEEQVEDGDTIGPKSLRGNIYRDGQWKKLSLADRRKFALNNRMRG